MSPFGMEAPRRINFVGPRQASIGRDIQSAGDCTLRHSRKKHSHPGWNLAICVRRWGKCEPVACVAGPNLAHFLASAQGSCISANRTTASASRMWWREDRWTFEWLYLKLNSMLMPTRPFARPWISQPLRTTAVDSSSMGVVGSSRVCVYRPVYLGVYKGCESLRPASFWFALHPSTLWDFFSNLYFSKT